ncbi:phosphoglycerate mutase family protein [Sinorhizobium numidicum]|uniref:Phosphoglycerate mutase family protein n=1 Tax=Sinorhizobium numidicum TaxID=680248 RepID=A0ABY8D4A2_9HYPH|nr:histidine phosphatase family protein [Sinorhizobium numidicum]WEX77710.1 phosphoglycerate mutase family protein [Sinorhizobium numidicum]WEX84370.1 phosphoglycerate mutase family protein [Sinorhizobium numidicum]
MFGVYLTHPQVTIDPTVPVPEWGLSDLGRERTRATAGQVWVRSLGRIVSSKEKKAIETAATLAEAAGTAVETDEEMGENDRSATGFLPPQEFEKAADWFFAHPDESFRGWERASDAQRRISAAVSYILDRHDPTVPIAFVGHGGVGTLLKCQMMGRSIGRSDQLPGGGNLFAFRLADRCVTCDWTPMEFWQG